MLALAVCVTVSCISVPVYAEKTEEESVAEEIVMPEDAIYLSTAEDVLILAENCIEDSWSREKTIVLSNDIDMTGMEFEGIPTFGGTFYGQGFTISGIHMEQEMTAMGFFRYLQKKAVVDNLRIEAVVQSETGKSYAVGGFAGVNNGTIQNCTFAGLVTGTEQIGGITGWNKTAGIIENCIVEGVVYGNHYIGGIAGENQGVIRQCTNMAEVNTEVDHNSIPMDMTEAMSLDMKMSLDMDMNSFSMKESTDISTNIGGIAGTSSGVIRECVNKANVGYQKMGYNVGGIAGSQIGYMTDCVNYAEINGSDGVGGIIGQFRPNVVLEFGPNPMDTMNAQMNKMTASMKNVMNSMKEIEMGSVDISFDTSSIENALDILGDTENLNEDSLNAVMNDLSNTVNNTYNEISNMTDFSGLTDSMNNVMSSMKGMMSTMEGMMNSMSTMSMSMEIEIVDISRNDKEKDTIAKAYNCTNYGEVHGEVYVGGIAGLAAIENSSMQEDMESKGDMSMEGEVIMRLVIRDCRNYATLSASKEYAGGIVGNMEIGAVIHGMNIGNIDSLNADYVGGIAGGSDTLITDSYSKCIMAGSDYVGGIAGFGTEVTDSYAFTDIAAYTKFAGGILGNTEVLPDEDDDLVTDNYYYLNGKNVGGIDGISYAGATEKISSEEYLALEDLDEMFKNVTVRFSVEGQEDIVKTIASGESIALADVPVPDIEESQIYDWEYVKPVTSKILAMNEEEEIFYLSEARLSNILFDQHYEAVIDAKHMVSQGENKTEDNKSIILAIGSFDPNTSVVLKDMMQEENTVNEAVVFENWQVTISNIGVEKLHYRIPEGVDVEDLVLYVKDADKVWTEREFMVEGSYIIFAFTDSDMNFALEEKAGGILSGNSVVVIAIAAGAVCMLMFASKKKKHAKSKK